VREREGGVVCKARFVMATTTSSHVLCCRRRCWMLPWPARRNVGISVLELHMNNYEYV
jgi:hypothetical protein